MLGMDYAEITAMYSTSRVCPIAVWQFLSNYAIRPGYMFLKMLYIVEKRGNVRAKVKKYRNSFRIRQNYMYIRDPIFIEVENLEDSPESHK